VEKEVTSSLFSDGKKKKHKEFWWEVETNIVGRQPLCIMENKGGTVLCNTVIMFSKFIAPQVSLAILYTSLDITIKYCRCKSVYLLMLYLMMLWVVQAI
jgi:hypothetical protein